MWRLNIVISYPLTWLVLILIITVALYYLKHNKTAGILLVIFVVFSLSLTPKGAEIWMDSVANITGVGGLKCGSIKSKTAILLPGGVLWLRDGSRAMTQWSEVRVNAITEDIKQGKISQVLFLEVMLQVS